MLADRAKITASSRYSSVKDQITTGDSSNTSIFCATTVLAKMRLATDSGRHPRDYGVGSGLTSIAWKSRRTASS